MRTRGHSVSATKAATKPRLVAGAPYTEVRSRDGKLKREAALDAREAALAAREAAVAERESAAQKLPPAVEVKVQVGL